MDVALRRVVKAPFLGLPRCHERIPRNLITDVAGLRVGNAYDAALASGVTVVLFDKATVASCAVLGGAPGTRETDLLEPDKMAPGIHAVVLSGGSAFGLDAASGVQACLRERGIGFAVGEPVPLVPQARHLRPREWRRQDVGPLSALSGARLCRRRGQRGPRFRTRHGRRRLRRDDREPERRPRLGQHRGTPPGMWWEPSSSSNSIASAVIGDGPHFWSGAFEENGEFGGHGHPEKVDAQTRALIWKGGPQPATTIALVATDAALTKAQAKRLAISSHAGIARGLRFSHALYDGDTVFAAATGHRPLQSEDDFTHITAAAADCLTRAIARGVYEATALPFRSAQPAWRDRFGPRTP